MNCHERSEKSGKLGKSGKVMKKKKKQLSYKHLLAIKCVKD